MAVPSLRSGKGGNYGEWKAAVDARNSAMRDANINITLRQNQMRDQMNTARQNLKAAKDAGDQAAIDQYTQELSGLQSQRTNLNKDTGRFVTNDTTQQLRVAGEQSQASWKRKQDEFKARTGMDYDASNPQHVRVMQNQT
jgi:predicted  nucleic acid-binding Zn-ribbon protein